MLSPTEYAEQQRKLRLCLHIWRDCSNGKLNELGAVDSVCNDMNYIFWLIGVIVVIIAILSFLGLR
jgi:hypothetical protein